MPSLRAWLNLETLLQTQMFPSLAARETYVAEANLRLGSKEMFLNQVKDIFASQKQILLMSGNNVSATMFPSLTRPLHTKFSWNTRRKILSEFSQGEQTIISFQGFLQDTSTQRENVRRTFSSCKPGFPSWPSVAKYLIIVSLTSMVSEQENGPLF